MTPCSAATCGGSDRSWPALASDAPIGAAGIGGRVRRAERRDLGLVERGRHVEDAGPRDHGPGRLARRAARQQPCVPVGSPDRRHDRHLGREAEQRVERLEVEDLGEAVEPVEPDQDMVGLRLQRRREREQVAERLRRPWRQHRDALELRARRLVGGTRDTRPRIAHDEHHGAGDHRGPQLIVDGPADVRIRVELPPRREHASRTRLASSTAGAGQTPTSSRSRSRRASCAWLSAARLRIRPATSPARKAAITNSAEISGCGRNAPTVCCSSWRTATAAPVATTAAPAETAPRFTRVVTGQCSQRPGLTVSAWPR